MKGIDFKNDSNLSDFGRDNDWQIITLSRNGVSKAFVIQLGNQINFSIEELSNILNISERTLKSYRKDKILDKNTSERTIELANLAQHGFEVFGNIARFSAWMKCCHTYFRKQRPIDILDTYRGFQMVHDELGRIEHGVYI
jgi:putative toxin-antitoxin system antitoxin component (TIGR02293 family)